MTKFTPDSYIFLTPEDSTDELHHIKFIDPDHKFAGVVIRVNWVKIDKGFLGKAVFSYDFSVLLNPLNNADTDTDEFKHFVGDWILDIWDRFYS